MTHTLTSEQYTALKEYAAENGRRWKQTLNLEWMTGRCPSGPLMQVRNDFGPSWLAQFSLTKMKTWSTVE
jgi:hypothetical protein